LISADERGTAVRSRGRRRPLSAEHDAARAASQSEHRTVCLYLELVRARRIMPAAEEEFVAVALSFARRNGIDLASWLEVGVDPAVLERARIGR
jgi:hypothetical protein